MNEYDVIVSKRLLSFNVPRGTMGTILIVYNSKCFEVEFVDSEGATLDVLTVNIEDISEYIGPSSSSSFLPN